MGSFHFLNIEYVFNRIYDVVLWIQYILFFKILGHSEEDYLAQHAGDDYNGLRDRFGLGSGGPMSDSTVLVDSGVNTFFKKLLAMFGGGDTTALVSSAVPVATEPSGVLYTFLTGMIALYRDLLTIVALILIGIYTYAYLGWKDAEKKYEKKFEKAYIPPKEKEITNTRWNIITAHIDSGNPAEWRLAILEADNMLSELLQTLPYAGTTVGEKLTNANKDNFRTLEDAWEAHKVRNRIAHEGAAFELTEREARRVISLYQGVFTEFNFGM